MKNLLIVPGFLMLFVLFTSCDNDNEGLAEEETASLNYVAEVKNGKIFIVDKQTLKIEWENKLRHSEEKVDLSNFRIVTGELQKGKENFIVMAENKSSNSKTAMALIKRGDRFYINEDMGTVTCYGTCTDGCDPQKTGERWICTSCNNFGNYTCNKKVTQDTGITESE